jgi:hypothetical protein
MSLPGSSKRTYICASPKIAQQVQRMARMANQSLGAVLEQVRKDEVVSLRALLSSVHIDRDYRS